MGAGSTAGNAGQLMSVSGQIGGTTESASYTYDLLGRLVTSNQTSNGASAQRRFVYDRWGNRTEVWDATSGGTQTQSVTLEQSGGAPTNRITSVTNSGSTVSYSYDSAGNVTSDGVHSYGYDAENRLVSVDGGSTASYSYDHQNRRVKKVVGSTTTHYVWQGWQVIAEHNGSSGAVLTEYVYAGSRMIAREQAGRVFFLQDRLSIRATITDGQGGIQGRQAHLPFGEELGTSGAQDKHKFTSYERGSETGSDYAINRQYSPALGRFTQVDPLAGLVDSPQSLNRYAYVGADPVDRTDVLGLGWVYKPVCEQVCVTVGDLTWCSLKCTTELVWEPETLRPVFPFPPPSVSARPAIPTGQGTSSPRTEPTWRQMRDAFLSTHPGCEVPLELLSITGEGVRFVDIEAAFIDTRTFTREQMERTLRELNFPEYPGADDLDRTLRRAMRRSIALANWQTNEVFLSPNWWRLGNVDPNRNTVHELMHLAANAGHVEIARRLNLKRPDGTEFTDELSAHDAINKYLDFNCSSTTIP
jgi:RHS repeat-associated protein